MGEPFLFKVNIVCAIVNTPRTKCNLLLLGTNFRVAVFSSFNYFLSTRCKWTVR